MNLFHYTSTSTFIERILPKLTLRTSFLNDMNDPRERELFAFGGVNVPYREIYGNYYSDETHIRCQYKLGEDIKNRIQISCFSGAKQDGWNNEMMWAQYGDRHRGVCLELDRDIIEDELKEARYNYKLEPIGYGLAEKGSIYWNKGLSIEDNIVHFMNSRYQSLALGKSSCWETEDEIRLVILNQKERIFIPIQKALKTVHLGTDFKWPYIHSIKSLLPKQVNIYKLIYQHYKFERWKGDFSDNGKWSWSD